MPENSSGLPSTDDGSRQAAKPKLIEMLSPAVLERSPVQRFAPGDAVIREGESGSSAFILLSGACEVVVHGAVINYIRQGELFGDVAFIEGGTRTATIRAVGEIQVLQLAAEDLRAELHRSPALLDEFLRGMAQRARHMSRRETTARDEHRELRRVMEGLQPPLDRFKNHPVLSVDVCWRPLTYASGDYYDVFELSANRFLFALGDVMGHGAQTAPVFAMVRSQLHETVTPESRPGELLAHLHRHLRRHGDPNCFMTLTLLVLDLNASTAEFAVAGPPAPLLYSGGRCRTLTTEIGWTLGYPFDGVVFTGERLQLAPGDALLFYTDGVSDAACGPDREKDTLDMDRLSRLFGELCQVRPPAIAEAVMSRVDQFRAGWAPEDDATVMVVGMR